MSYILIGTLLGSIITSSHDTREACEGRAVLLREKGSNVQCVQQQQSYISLIGTWSSNCGVANTCPSLQLSK